MTREYYTNLLQRANHRALAPDAPSYNDPDGKLVRELLDAMTTLLDERDSLDTVNEVGEPRGLSPALDHWRERWAVAIQKNAELMTYITELRVTASKFVHWYESSRSVSGIDTIRTLLERDITSG